MYAQICLLQVVGRIINHSIDIHSKNNSPEHDKYAGSFPVFKNAWKNNIW